MPETAKQPQNTIVFVTTEDWYFLSHRLSLARQAQKAGFSVVLASRIEGKRERLESEGIAVAELPWRRSGFLSWRDGLAVFGLIRLYRQIQPSIVHHVALKPILLGTLAARIAGVPNVVNAVAGLGFLFTSQSRWARILRMLFLIVARPLMGDPRLCFLFQNDDDRALLTHQLKLDPARSFLIPGVGVDLAAFPMQPLAEHREIIVVLAARMLRIKGIDLAVSAILQLRAEGVAIRLELAGMLDESNPSAIPLEELNIWCQSEGIIWHGHREDIAALWAEADIAMLPSRGGEGLPKAMLEAAASGRPMVGTDVPGIREVVRDGITGFLVPPDDPDALACALRRLALDPALRRQMGAAARAHVAAHFSQAEIVKAIGRLHESLLAGREGPQPARI